jgi:hypothetical protein
VAGVAVDAVLLLGPLYHLVSRAERTAAIGEAARILRPGGPLFAAAISRWATRIDGIVGKRIYLEHPNVLDLIDEVERSGDLDARMADPADRAVILDAARSLERVPELIGFGPHLLATAIRAAVG